MEINSKSGICLIFKFAQTKFHSNLVELMLIEFEITLISDSLQ